jgi:hypothetical protein
MTRRRVQRLEDQAGTGRAAWARWAAAGLGAALEAAGPAHAPTVRRVFASFRGEYAPGADPHEGADRALDTLHEALPRDVYACCLAHLMRTGS